MAATAAAASISNTSLAVTLAHAVSYLTAPLATSPASPYNKQTIMALQAALEANLAAVYVVSWCPNEPLRGSGRRCLSFAPGQLPPRPVYAACRAAGVDWPQWMRCLGGREFDLFVDPGCVGVRLGAAGAWGQNASARASLVTVWSAEMEAQQDVELQLEALRLKQRELELQQRQLEFQASQTQHKSRKAPIVPMATKPKTLAQSLMEADGEDEDALFSLLADEIRQPTWMTPILEQFPVVPVPLKHTAATFVPSRLSSQAQSQVPTVSSHSRSSSRSSMTSSSGFSYISDDSTVSSCASLSSIDSSSTTSLDAKTAMSRRERTRQANVFVDKSRTEVTPYDGGKTTVLTGGVMLGAASARKPTQQRRF